MNRINSHIDSYRYWYFSLYSKQCCRFICGTMTIITKISRWRRNQNIMITASLRISWNMLYYYSRSHYDIYSNSTFRTRKIMDSIGLVLCQSKTLQMAPLLANIAENIPIIWWFKYFKSGFGGSLQMHVLAQDLNWGWKHLPSYWALMK